MEKKYYFFGTPSGANEEIKKILKDLSVPFKQIEPSKYGSYLLKEEDVKELVEAGYSIVCVDANNVSGYAAKVMKRSDISCLDLIMVEHNLPSNAWLDLVRENDEYHFLRYPYSTMGMDMLVRSGYSRKDINAVRAYDRKAKGVTKVEEKQTDEALKNAVNVDGLLIVDELPHSKFQSVLDKAFWLQRYQNVVIFSTDGNFLYYGYATIAFEVMKAGYAQITSWCYNEGTYNEAKKQALIKLLKKHARLKKRQLML